jgi:hypothetical protein
MTMEFFLDWIVPVLLIVMLVGTALRKDADDPERESNLTTAALIAIVVVAILLPSKVLWLKFLMLPLAYWVLSSSSLWGRRGAKDENAGSQG